MSLQTDRWDVLLKARSDQGWTIVNISDDMVEELTQAYEPSEAKDWIVERLGPMVDRGDFNPLAPELWDVVGDRFICCDAKVALLFKLTWCGI